MMIHRVRVVHDVSRAYYVQMEAGVEVMESRVLSQEVGSAQLQSFSALCGADPGSSAQSVSPKN